MFGTLGVIMFNLKNELMQKYGKNNIYLREVLNSDNTLMIFYGGGTNHGHCVGQVNLTDNGWVLEGFMYDVFEEVLEYEKGLHDIGVLN